MLAPRSADLAGKALRSADWTRVGGILTSLAHLVKIVAGPDDDKLLYIVRGRLIDLDAYWAAEIACFRCRRRWRTS